MELQILINTKGEHMNNETIIEFINSCINDCEMNLENFKEEGFVELSRLNDENWCFFVCTIENGKILVSGHYPLLGGTANDISDLLTYLHDNNIKLTVRKNFADKKDLSICGQLFYDFESIDVSQKKLDIEMLCDNIGSFYLPETSNDIIVNESFGSVIYGQGISINIPTPDGHECIYGTKDTKGFHFKALIKTYKMPMLDYILDTHSK